MKKSSLILTIVFVALCINKVAAQDQQKSTGPLATLMAFSCTSTSDDSIQLKATISVRHDDGTTYLLNAPVTFSVVGNDHDIIMGTIKTDIHGTAAYKIPAKNQFPRKDAQLISFKSVYEGNNKYASSEGEFALKPSKLVVSFYEEDTLRFVKVVATQYNPDGTETPLGPADLVVSVPKMFSMLKIAAISLDSTGIGTAEFPHNLIGDSLGNITVIAGIEENEIYGNVIGKATNGWGLHKHLISPDRPSRELWTPIAPLWMIVTLIIMLAGVWGHYIYAVIQLIMINKSSKVKVIKEETNE